MAKSSFVRLPADELAMVQEVRRAESFRHTAWDQYGVAWQQNIPQTVNAFCHYYFGTILFPWHLAVHYAPINISEITIIGARGCAKTEGLALVWAIYRALHPGADHLHIAPTKDQANRTVDAILKWGVNGFTKTFIDDVVRQPFPEIRFKRWDELDQGAKILVRSLGDEDIERLRSHSAEIVSGDEFFREVETGDTAAQLRGCIRGVNNYMLKQRSKEVQTQYQGLIRAITLTLRPEKRAEYQDQLEQLITENDLGIRGLMCLYGNAGMPDWAWERFDRGESEPEHYWSIRVRSADNPTFTKKDLEALARSFGDNDDLREVEMEGKRPMNLGNEFAGHLIRSCTDETLLKEAQAAMTAGQPGYLVGRHAQHGIYLYCRPPVDGHRYAAGADPGTGLLPGRNKFVITVFDISVTPCEMVYFEMGYLSPKQTGHYHGFMGRLKYVQAVYPMSEDDLVVESTGPQKGMTELSFPEDMPVTAVDFTSEKPRLINYLKQLMGKYLLRWPHVERILQELGNYTQPDTEISQDVVMALICAARAIWKYHGFKLPVKPDKVAQQAVPFARNTRMTGTRQWGRTVLK